MSDDNDDATPVHRPIAEASGLQRGSAFRTLWRASRSTTSGIDDIHRSLIKIGLSATSLKPLARSSTAINDLPTVKEVRAALRSLLATKLAVTDAASWSSLVNAQPIYETARYILICAYDDAIRDTKAKGHLIRGPRVRGRRARLTCGGTTTPSSTSRLNGSPKQRVTALKQGNLYQLSAKSKTLLESANSSPSASSSLSPGRKTFDRDYV